MAKKGYERITYDEDGALDEVVGSGGVHLERLDDDEYFLSCQFSDGSEFRLWLRCDISLTEKLAPNLASSDTPND